MQTKSDPFDGDATRSGRKKEKDEESGFSTFDFSQMFEPNRLVDTMLNLTLIIFDQIENHTPLKSFELPIVERSVRSRPVLEAVGLESFDLADTSAFLTWV